MARVYWRPKAGHAGKKKEAPEHGSWWMDLRKVGGMQQRLPTARTKAEAERLAHDEEERLYRVRRGLAVEAKPVTFGEAAASYVEATKHLSSWAHVDSDLRLHVPDWFKRRLMGELNPADVEKVAAENRAKGLALGTVKRVQVRIGAVYRWAQRKGRVYHGDNPAQGASTVRLPERAPRYFTLEQLERLLAALSGQLRLVVLTAALTGMRKQEVVGLRREDVDRERSLLTVRRSSPRAATTKGRRERVIPLPSSLLEELCRHMMTHSSPWLFPAEDGSPYGRTWHAKGFASAMERAGLAGTGLLFKDLRSTFGTHLVAQTGDLRLAQVLLGHSRPEVTAKHYAHAHVDYLREGMGRLRLVRDGAGTRDNDVGGDGGRSNGKGATK